MAITQSELAQELCIKKCVLNRMLTGKGNVRKGRAKMLEAISGVAQVVFMAGEGKEITEALEKVYGKINFTRGRPLGGTK